MDKRAKEKDEIYLKQEKLKNRICNKKKEIRGQFNTIYDNIPENYKNLNEEKKKEIAEKINIDIEQKAKELKIELDEKKRDKKKKMYGISEQDQEMNYQAYPIVFELKVYFC